MEGNNSKNIEQLLATKDKKEKRIKEFLHGKKEKEKELDQLLAKERELKKEKSELLAKESDLKDKIDVLNKNEEEVKRNKEVIEEKEKAEIDWERRKGIEKTRWEEEEKRKEIESKKWKVEDVLREVREMLEEKQREIEERTDPMIEKVGKETKELGESIKKETEELSLLEKKIVLLREKKDKEELEKEREKERAVKEEKKVIKEIRKKAQEEELRNKVEQEKKKKEEELQEKKELKHFFLEAQKAFKEKNYALSEEKLNELIEKEKGIRRLSKKESYLQKIKELRNKIEEKKKRIKREDLLKKAEEHLQNEKFDQAITEAQKALIEAKKSMGFLARLFKKDHFIIEAEKLIKIAKGEARIKKETGKGAEEKIRELLEKANHFFNEGNYNATASFTNEIIESLEYPKERQDIFERIRKKTDLLEKAKSLEVKAKKEKTEKEEEKVVRQIIKKAKEEAIGREKQEEIKSGEEKKSKALQEKFDNILEVIKKNREEIASLKGELQEKEEALKKHKNAEKEASEEELEKEREQISLIEEKVKEEYEKLAQREKVLKEHAQIAEDLTVEGPIEEVAEKREEKTEPAKEEKEERQVDLEEREKSERDKGMKHGEAAALFEKAKQSFHYGSLQIAKERFQRIVENYDSEDGKSFLSPKSKPLDERAEEYIKEIDKTRKKEEMTDIEEERKEIEEKIQEALKERREMKKKIDEADKKGEDTKQIEKDFEVLEKERMALERELGMKITEMEERKEKDSPRPKKVIREVVREKIREPDRESIRKEIEGVLREKQELIEQRTELKEIKSQEAQIKEKKKELEKQEKEAEDGEEKEEIKERVKEMEEELRRLIKEETSEKWEKRIKGVEGEIATINKRYRELTEKEESLRGKIEEIQDWGPLSRKKKEDVYEYRTIYKKRPKRKDDVSKIKKGSPAEKKKKESLIKNLFSRIRSFRPSKDFFLRPPTLVSIDISDFSVEFFSIDSKGAIISFGRTILEEGIVYNGEIRDKEKLKKALVSAFKEAKPSPIKRKNGVRIKGILSLPNSKTFIQQFKVGTKEDVFEKTQEEIKRNIPIPIEDLYFHYHVTVLPKTKEKAVLYIAVPKTAIDEYVNLLESLDIDPLILDIEDAARGRALLTGEEKKKSRDKMIVDIGARGTTISIFKGTHLVLSVGIPFGGAYFTDKIAAELNVSKEEAEKKKKKSGLKGELKDILSSSLNTITEEIRRAEEYYHRELNGKVDSIILTGGSSLMLGILDYFKKELGEKVEIGNPLQKIKSAKGLTEKDAVIFVNAIGLALRATEENTVDNGFNLLPEKIKKRERLYLQERRKSIRITAILIAVIGFILFMYALYYFFFM